MSSIPIDHLGRDELITLLNRVAARLSIVSGNYHLVGTPQTSIDYGYLNLVSPNDILRPPTATNRYRIPLYEEEHDPWNAHLRSANSASSSETAPHTGQTGAQTHSSHSWSHSRLRDLPTATRLTDAMTCRYCQVDMQNSEHNRLRPEHGTEDTTNPASPIPERNLCDCSNTCNYCSSVCCLRKKGHTVHLCLIHKIP